MKVRVFYKIAPTERLPSSDLETRVFSIQDELAKLKKELGAEKDAQEKLRLQRKIARLERFNDLQEGKTSPEGKDTIQTILKGKSSDNYLGSDLLSLKKHGVDITPLVLVYEKNPEQNVSSSSITVGDSFIVNFGLNKHLRDDTGAGDILPPSIKKIEINGIECEYRNTPRPGYYNDSRKPSYQKIYDGYNIKIVSKESLNNEENKSALLAGENRWKHLRASDMIDYNEKNPLTSLDEDKALFSEVTRVAQEREAIKKKYEREILGFDKITPGSEACIDLFRNACKFAGIDESWAGNPSLHELLRRESGGYIGRLNYTLGDMSLLEFKDIATKGNRVPARSSASGLGQLLLDNVDRYYPSGRNGIGNPLEEAVGMIRYIKDRYGDPSTAMSVYGRIGTYTHADTGMVLTKNFQEGY